MSISESHSLEDVVGRLKSLSNPENVAGMARFGINPDNALGVSIPEIRKIGRQTGKNHALALQLWDSDTHEARILACVIDDPKQVTEKQMDEWVKDFDSWDICDQCCLNLFRKTEYAETKLLEWSASDIVFTKRAGFALMAILAVHGKKSPDSLFEKWLTIIVKGAADDRNFVKKAVNWALRQIGKRNIYLNKKAVATANEISKLDSKSARWIATNALRELTSDAVQKRLREKSKS